MRYVRLQSKKYEINENSRSFEWGFADVYDAMMTDIDAVLEPIRDAEAYDHPLLQQYSEIIDLEDEEEKNRAVEEFWTELDRPGMCMRGVSCYEYDEDAAEKLYEYFSERAPEDLDDDKFYVLVFEGIDTNREGHNGENVVIWERDIERIPVSKFFEGVSV